LPDIVRITVRHFRNYNVILTLSFLVHLFLDILRHCPVITFCLLRTIMSETYKRHFLPRNAICYKLSPSNLCTIWQKLSQFPLVLRFVILPSAIRSSELSVPSCLPTNMSYSRHFSESCQISNQPISPDLIILITFLVPSMLLCFSACCHAIRMYRAPT
jgi:hypothetical protein